MKPDNTTKWSSTATIVYDSFPGLKRKQNEDKVFCYSSDDYIIFGVLDGVGSSTNNQIATQIAIEFISNNHYNYFSKENYYVSDLIIDINNLILKQPHKDMKATCAIGVLLSNSKFIFNALGDTRVYDIGKHFMTQISTDNVLSSKSNIITRCLGIPLDEKEVIDETISEFNNILICSDGFYNIMERNRLDFFEAFSLNKQEKLKSELNNLTKGQNSDDATYILIKNV